MFYDNSLDSCANIKVSQEKKKGELSKPDKSFYHNFLFKEIRVKVKRHLYKQ